MATIERSGVFATGAGGATGLDSLTLGKNSLWAEYGNGADSTGLGGTSTIVQYSLGGKVENTYSIAGSVDGLKLDPATGKVFALQNQDGNSTLSLINPGKGTITGPLSYAVTSAAHGHDDVAFLSGQVYLSYTNPVGEGDPVLQVLANGNMPMGTLTTSTILADGATGFDITTGMANQPIPLSDPDSLKTTPTGGLVLTSGNDNAFTVISDPGTKAQSERFVQLTNLPAGSSLDDVIIPTSSSGTFYVSNAGTNQVLSYKVSGLNTSDAYASVGTEIVQVDLQTGAETPLVTGLSGSHGLAFRPAVVKGPLVQSTKIFAVGAEAGNSTQPDSVTLADGSTWIEYGNNADSTGKLPNQGSSTIVQYSALGKIEHTYSLPGEIDGLKYDPTTGDVWALKNQDANSHLYIIDPKSGHVSGPLSYASPYVYGATSSRGYDDVAFDGNKVFLSYANPKAIGDSVVQLLDNGNSPTGPLVTTSILRLGDTGTNMVTGQVNQPLPVADPDSIKMLSDGSLILTSDHDKSLTVIAHPGTEAQSESFITLPAGSSGLDDAIMPTSTSGTFVISNAGADDVLKVKVTGLITSDIYVSVGTDNAVDQLDPKTGALTPIITGLNSPHGLAFIPTASAALAQDLLPGSGSTTAAASSGSAGAALPQHSSATPMLLAHVQTTVPSVTLTPHA